MFRARILLERAGQAAFGAVFWFNVFVMAVALAMAITVLVLFPKGWLFSISLGLFATASIVRLWKQAKTQAARREMSNEESPQPSTSTRRR